MLNTFKRLLQFAVPFRGRIILSVLWGFATVASGIGLMATSAWLISKSGLQPSIADLGISVVAVRFFGVFRGVFRYLERLVSHDVTFRMLANIRVWFYTYLEPLAPARLAQYRSGDLLGRIVSDVETLQNLYIRVIAPPIVASLVMLVMVIFFAIIDFWVMLAMLAFVLFTATVLPLMAWWEGRRFGPPLVQTRGELNASLTDSIQGLADALAFGYEGQQLQTLETINTQYRKQEDTIARFDSLQTGVGVLLVNLAAVIVLYVAIPRVDGILLATVTLATIAAFEAFTPLAITANHFAENIEAANRLFDIVDSTPAVVDAPETILIPHKAQLRVENLVFRYEDDATPALDHISFAVEQGERIAIVGASGAGKSSLVNVLLRFWDYNTGKITLGGVDLKDIAQEDVHQFFAVMSQRTHLFNTTIHENIRIASANATDAEIQRVAGIAQIATFIESQPDGYKTQVGEFGARLSGGERQRIALARMLLKDAPYFIFDEATANLDSVTEAAVMQSILSATHDRATLFITHRLTLLEQMHRIIVLQHGKIVESGSHDELIRQDGYYSNMLHLQRQTLM